MVVALHTFKGIVVPDYLNRNFGRKMKTHAKKVVFTSLENTLTMILCIEIALCKFFHIIPLVKLLIFGALEALFLDRIIWNSFLHQLIAELTERLHNSGTGCVLTGHVLKFKAAESGTVEF
ncbi:hypothetical protein ACOSQ3_010867 [Xanthoceras sorbifolium]